MNKKLSNDIERAVRKYLSLSKIDGEAIPVEKVDLFVSDVLQKSKQCLICQDRSTNVGIFQPEKPWDFGSPEYVPGRRRVIFYGVCSKCFRKGPSAIEKALSTTR